MAKNFVRLCLSTFQVSLQQTLPSECVKQVLQISNKIGNEAVLLVNNREYRLNHNIHIVAIGKAANGMVSGAEDALGTHFVDGVAAAPVDSPYSPTLKTKCYVGAAHNLPDDDALVAAVKITEFVERISRMDDQIILFLVSGGGSALLPAPRDGLTLKDKLAIIQLLTQNGADIKQLNTVRIALSSLKGGKLAKLGKPAKMIGLIMSDIVGDPINLISSGPTVSQNIEPSDVIKIFQQLNISDQVPEKVYEILQTNEMQDPNYADVNNVIIANNLLFLETLADSIRRMDATLHVSVVTSTIVGDVSEVGIKFADVIMTAAEGKEQDLTKNVSREFAPLLHGNEPCQLNDNFKYKRMVFLFGGETTVLFPAHPIALTAKGGRNQELILAALRRLSERRAAMNGAPAGFDFALFSLGTDGQDGPTDAAGAFITRADIFADANLEEMTAYLSNKNSYEFWANRWRDGKNLVRFGKTGTNLMDVQILYIQFA